MGNCVSKELAHAGQQGDNSDAIEIIKNVYQALLLAKEKLPEMSTGTGQARKNIDDNDELKLKAPMASSPRQKVYDEK